MKKEKVFEKLWNIYTSNNPSVKKVYDLFEDNGETVINDHIAFRTFDLPKVNIDVISRIFLEIGYVYKQDYHFEEKKLYAKHFEHTTDKNAPRIFISELKTEDFSPFLQETVKSIIDKVDNETLNPENLVFSGISWGKPSFETYEKLRSESEYAAWLYVFGFQPNHFTVSVNALGKYDTLQKVNQLLKDNGFTINDSGGEIKGSPGQLLEQSSIKSEMVSIEFREGTYQIPGCYYEFAKRYPDKDGNLYSGFIARSADKIFESTDYYKK